MIRLQRMGIDGSQWKLAARKRLHGQKSCNRISAVLGWNQWRKAEGRPENSILYHFFFQSNTLSVKAGFSLTHYKSI